MRCIDRRINGHEDRRVRWRRWAAKVGGGAVCRPTAEGKPPAWNEKLYYGSRCRQTRWDLLHMHSWVCKSEAQSTVKGFWCQTKRAEIGRARFAVITSAAESAPRHEGGKRLTPNKNSGKPSNCTKAQCAFVLRAVRSATRWQVRKKKDWIMPRMITIVIMKVIIKNDRQVHASKVTFNVLRSSCNIGSVCKSRDLSDVPLTSSFVMWPERFKSWAEQKTPRVLNQIVFHTSVQCSDWNI